MKFCITLFYVLVIVKANELVDMVAKSCEAGDDMKTTRLILGALKQLKQSRIKPDHSLNISIATIAKDNPKLFATPEAIEVSKALIKISLLH